MEQLQDKTVLSDEQIIQLYFSREERAIAETDQKYGKYLLTIAQNVLSNTLDSEECVNDTYLKTWNAIPPACPNIFRAFLAKITRRTAFDRYDEAKRQKRIPKQLCETLSDFEGYLPDNNDPQEELEARELGRIISDWLQALPDQKLYMFLSRYFFVVPVADIAQKLGCSESTVYKELAAMKKQLRQRFAQEGYEI